ncbi:MAG: hypothetical protein ACK4TA_06300 [Saprospiraceae bacterium]
MQKETFTRRELQFNITDIVNSSLIHVKNVIEQIQYLYNCSIAFIPSDPYRILPTDNFPFIIHSSDKKNRNSDDLKNDSIQWIIKKGVEELILGINLSLSESYKYLKYFGIVTEANKLWNEEKISHELEKVHKNVRRMHIPELLDSIEKMLGQNLEMKEEILSINKYRSCLVHRNGVVSEFDINSPNSLLELNWYDYSFFVKLSDGSVVKMDYELRKNGIEIEIDKIILEKYYKAFGLGDQLNIDINEFNGLGITSINFIRAMYQMVYDKIIFYNYAEQGIDLKIKSI